MIKIIIKIATACGGKGSTGNKTNGGNQQSLLDISISIIVIIHTILLIFAPYLTPFTLIKHEWIVSQSQDLRIIYYSYS